MFARLSVSKKIAAALSLLISITFLLGFYSIDQISKVNSTSTEIKDNWMPSIVMTSDLNTLTSDHRLTTLNHITSLTEQEMRAFEKEQDEIHKSMELARKDYEKLISSDEEKKMYEQFSKIWSEYLVENDAIIKMSRENKNDEAKALLRGKSRKLFEEASQILKDAVAINVKGGDAASDRGDVMYEESRSTIIVSIFIAIISSAIVGWMLISSLNKSLRLVIQNLQTGSDNVTTAASEIASASNSLSAAAIQQSAALQEAVASITEMNETARGSSENALKSKDIAEESMQVAFSGQLAISQMLDAVEEINRSNTSIQDQVEDSNKKISEIIDVINNIESKTKVINDIVFQTKLLSFNASVEAARAGENGKGFAVVAEEVGNLAHMSGSAANDISNMLAESISKVQGIIDETKTKVEHLMVNGKGHVSVGRSRAEKCKELLEQIVSKVSTAKEMSAQIAASCREQSLGVEQIEKAMIELEHVNTQNTSSSQQCSSSAEELSGQAKNLDQLIDVLVQTVEGKSETFKRSEVVNIKKNMIMRKAG